MNSYQSRRHFLKLAGMTLPVLEVPGTSMQCIATPARE
jgi:hypothetical protein